LGNSACIHLAFSERSLSFICLWAAVSSALPTLQRIHTAFSIFLSEISFSGFFKKLRLPEAFIFGGLFLLVINLKNTKNNKRSLSRMAAGAVV
jgi:hypothetical protein